MDKKYQIFISSTYKDLIEQREAVVKNVLRMGHLPVGMEMFDAADDSQWEVIKRHINNSDYYLLIIARRYGSIDDDGVGFTEKEYSYALEQGVPCIAFMLDDSVKTWNNDFIDSGREKKRLTLFKSRFNKKLVNFWTTTDNLALQVSHSLSTLMTIKPRMGWIRGNEAASPLVAEEISRLSRENSVLQSKLLSQEGNKELNESQNILNNFNYTLTTYKNNIKGNYVVNGLELYKSNASALLHGVSKNYFYRNIKSELQKFSITDPSEISLLLDMFLDQLLILDLASFKERENTNILELTSKGKSLFARLNYN
ncbi:protein of unknown function [Hymenobacter gelipurpurascens]|uniref:DUF4062 domain-containing protein n=1 Tax=Hymenobacter gelipurpurascens TaxID=89968 RepID=A0A212UHD1_9BACT|nr:DUF4062 domain-containing protein [Hymenobacter gelipurpurascens]SNC77645.1 protein of unknown function [Hymenobacter gelipurpurascens]